MKMILMTVGVLWTSTLFSQYFSKTYPDPVRRPLISNIECDNNYLSITIEIISCDDGMHQCCQISGINQDGSRAWQKYKSYFQGNQYTLKIRHDTVFYSGNSNVLPDSMMYWYFGMMHTNGDSIAEYRYPILHLKDTGIGSFGYKIPYNYGMTLVNNNEVILWGEGLDIRMPLPNPKVYRRSVFQRIGINGERKGEPFWFEASNHIFRRMSDACTDIDGNMVFNYEYVTTPDINNDNGCRRGIFKIMPDNSIDTIVKVTQDALNNSLPKIAIDSQGNYFINPIYLAGKAPGYEIPIGEVGFISKVNRKGEVLWTSMITPYLPHPTTHFGAYHTEKISRISTTRNGDILVAGESFVIDSFDIPGESQTKELSGYGGFIARFDTNGKLLWRHFTFPLKKDGSRVLFHVFTDIKEAPDGSIITSGRLEQDSSDIPYILDAWLMRLTPEGCLDKDCSHVGRYWMFPGDISPTLEAYQWSTPPSIFPNPGSQRFHIRVSQEVQFPIRYQLKDITGRLYEQGTFDTQDINIHTDYLPSGSFIISLQDHSGKIWHGKWIKA